MMWMAPRPRTDTTRPAHWAPPGQARSGELRARPAVCAAAAGDPYEGDYPRRGSSGAA